MGQDCSVPFDKDSQAELTTEVKKNKGGDGGHWGNDPEIYIYSTAQTGRKVRGKMVTVNGKVNVRGVFKPEGNLTALQFWSRC